VNRRTILGTAALAGTVLLIAVVAGCVAFFPSAKEPGYEFVAAWGEKGDGPGQFNDPTGIAVADGEVFVADARNGRIQVFDLEGNFRRAFGAPGKNPGQLGRPMNLTIEGDELYVPEYFNDRIQVFGLDGTARRIVGKAGDGPGEFNAPGGVAVAPDGDLFVVDFYNQRVQRLEADGTFVRQWGTTGEIGISAGAFNYPTDVALAADGTLYVADGYGDRVQAFASDGAFSHKWGGPFAMNIFGPFNGWFAVATGVAVGPEGNVFVADFYNDRVQKFAPDGTFLTSFGEEGGGPGQLNHAIAVEQPRPEVAANSSRVTKAMQSAPCRRCG
jgi:DNA-binding beta-propeller fold protein YncE